MEKFCCTPIIYFLMNNSKRLAVVFFSLLCLLLVFAGCSKVEPEPKGGRRISKVTKITNARLLVEDMASGQIISDDSEPILNEESSFIWDGNVLTNYTLVNDGILLSSLVYSYADGKLVEVKDECDGMEVYFYYSDGYLDHIISTTMSSANEIGQLSYDEHGRAKSIRYTLSDGSYLPEAPNCYKYVPEFEYSGSDITLAVCQYFNSIESEVPSSTTSYEVNYSTAINPLRGIYTVYAEMEPWEYFSEHYMSAIQSGVAGKPMTETKYEVTMGQEYPVQVSASSIIQTDITDGVRTTYEYISLITYEYLD